MSIRRAGFLGLLLCFTNVHAESKVCVGNFKNTDMVAPYSDFVLPFMQRVRAELERFNDPTACPACSYDQRLHTRTMNVRRILADFKSQRGAEYSAFMCTVSESKRCCASGGNTRECDLSYPYPGHLFVKASGSPEDSRGVKFIHDDANSHTITFRVRVSGGCNVGKVFAETVYPEDTKDKEYQQLLHDLVAAGLPNGQEEP